MLSQEDELILSEDEDHHLVQTNRPHQNSHIGGDEQSLLASELDLNNKLSMTQKVEIADRSPIRPLQSDKIGHPQDSHNH
jgi:hypothetical protein